MFPASQNVAFNFYLVEISISKK